METLIKQSGVEYEILLIDDGSSKVIDANSLPKEVTLFRRKHSGTALSRNFGASKAKGEVLVFVDGDMYFEETFLDELTKPIRLGKSKGTYSTEEFVANWDNVWARCWNWENGLKTSRRISTSRNDMVRDFRAILKKEFERVGGFSNTGYTDTWSLSKKLGYLPQKTQAKYFHYNPSSLKEVYWHASWVGKRERKYGLTGKLLALARVLFPVSLIIGVKKAIEHSEGRYIWFKMVYDLGIASGIVASLVTGRIIK
ncbi:MAG: glycosyltransferase family 2 protein [Patescibacteria group bacterium]